MELNSDPSISNVIHPLIENISIESTFIEEHGDIFHCGRCKINFHSFFDFINHKKGHATDEIIHTPKTNEVNLMTLEPSNQIWVWNPGTSIAADKSVIISSQLNTEDIITEEIEYNAAVDDIQTNNIDVVDESTFSAIPVKDDIGVETPQYEKSLLTCSICNREFKKQFHFFLHLRSHSGEKPYQCIICGRTFLHKSSIRKHMFSHKVWPDGLSRTLPEKAIGKNVGFQCLYCDTILSDYFKLKVHLKEHGEKKMYKCIQGKCSMMFIDLELLISHVKADHTTVEYHCHVCLSTFASLDEISSHQKMHGAYSSCSKTEKKFTCVYCTAVFKKHDHLTHHLATANHENPCSHCNKIFVNERNLRRHLTTHDEVKSFKCHICNASFRKKHYLCSHLLTHTKEKMFVCTVCNARFARKDILARHVRIHQPNEKKQCPFRMHLGCMMEFSRTDKLNLHIKSHTRKLDPKKKSTKNSTVKDIEKSKELPTMEIIIVPLSESNQSPNDDNINKNDANEKSN